MQKILFTALVVVFVSCQSEKQKADSRGEALATQYCGSCHAVPAPDLLDKQTWKERVLPAMAKQLKLEVFQGTQYHQNEQSMISYGEWTELLAYYDSLAPAKLSISPEQKPLKQSWASFEGVSFANQNMPATTTLAAFGQDGNVFTSSANIPVLAEWNATGKLLRETPLPSSAVDLFTTPSGEQIVTSIGEMKAFDRPAGSVLSFNGAQYIEMATDLPRPVNTVVADLNGDKLDDYVVCGFGHNQGGLFWLKQLPSGGFDKTMIREIAGATQAITGDFDNNGTVDILALFAHGNEGIRLFSNDGKGNFTEKSLLTFPPVYGSSSFQLADFNSDGKQDIVYTAGDNSDYSRILKPYHGVYIFLNEGKKGLDGPFKKAWFYPINGATRVAVADFNVDGLPDLFTIAFFADFKNRPEEGAIYFENRGKLQFNPAALPVHKMGRWICMSTGDYDRDGDTDVVLGNYAEGFMNEDRFEPIWDTKKPFVILKNKTKP